MGVHWCTWVYTGAHKCTWVYIGLINFLKIKLKDVPPDQWNKVFIAYDNICNIERMKAAKEDLPFPEAYNMLWKRTSKIIDTFHLRNHKREECHKKYNIAALKDIHPTYNTQACEQIFSWLVKFHRILSSMPKVHNNFSYTD